MQFSITFAEDTKSEHGAILQRVLGQGKVFVYQVKVSALDLDLALKVFTKQSSSTVQFNTENKALRRLNHKNVISYIPVLNHSLPYDIIATEYTPNGDFFDFVTKGGMKTEKLARSNFHQLIDGISYIHSQNIAHLDIKLENILIDNKFSLKLIDFDQAQSADDLTLRSGGTMNYRAPEVIQGKCRDLKAVDVYAMGVILYCFKTGEMPFTESNGPKIPKTAKYETFCQNKESFWREKEREIRMELSHNFKQLLNGMWEQNIDKRFKIADIERSRWYNDEILEEEETRKQMQNFFEKTQIA